MLTNLSDTTFDAVIIGGGIMGTAIARDAALRGLKVILLEKDDFGSGTTSRSSRLIHGGLRYLAQFDFGLVRQDLTERELLLRNAPHLVQPLPFLIPIYEKGFFTRIKLGAGLRLYDWFARSSTLPSHRWLGKKDTLALEPGLRSDGLSGAYLYYDAQASLAERLCIENALDTQENGAVLLNHTKVTGITGNEDGRISSVKFENCFTGQIQKVDTRIVVNASGPELDDVNALTESQSTNFIRRTRGVHLITQPASSNAIVLFAKRDGRLFFVLPWLGHTLLGTTDVHEKRMVNQLAPNDEDIEYLNSETNQFIPAYQKSETLAAYIGVRALGRAEGKSESETSRDATILDHEKEGMAGMISLVGGKLTAHRGLAEEVTDLMCKKLNIEAHCATQDRPLPGTPPIEMDLLKRQAISDCLELRISEKTAKYLISVYGARYKKVLAFTEKDDRAGQRLSESSPAILAQVHHAVEKEWAKTLPDFLLRRSMLGLIPPHFGLDTLEAVASEMASRLGHSDSWADEQVASYRKFVKGDSWLKVYQNTRKNRSW